MKVVKQAPPRAPSALDVATKLASLAAPRPLVPALDQARRDATAVLDQVRGTKPLSYRDATAGPRTVPPLAEVDLVDALLPRRLAARVQQTRRDARMVLGALRGRRPSPTVPRKPGPRSEVPPPAADVLPLARTIQTRPLRVAEVVRETADAVSLYLEELDGTPLTFTPGQFMSLDVEVDGKVLRRAYSLASPALEGHAPHVTIKRVEGGRVSNHLNDHAKPGDVLQALGPSGAFTLEPDPTHERTVVLVAGGSGITPIASIASTLLEVEPASRVVLLYGNRRHEDVIFRERLDALKARFGDRFLLDHVLQEPPAGWTGATGLLDADTQLARLDALAVPDAPTLEYYVCGPTPMMEATRDALARRGVDPARVHEELFTRPEDRSSDLPPAGPQPLTVRLRGKERELTQGEGETLLEAGLAAGLPMPFSCAMGGCAACKVKLVEGEVDMEEPNCLTPKERAEGWVLACCSRAKKPVTVEVPS
ncbi:MAG TPA: ferredoxin--NADP reductase [Polyangiaceae bacterium LLY-WYZ-15_(1-7)]|nr:oxidoreductase [Sandaracinus sp.]HJL05911.1 ferredoxin--NADP reductase [Polyangiaceae bacterium LLY-WYZ-15_(1-7)]HJL09084.1 ferredoxin--NADP reductase [Polyangiaceae bacterium LLY-WYZ-15_(1-7)]HJL36471.1 ferredoxin--NADP reductase [Polyangiaceae bacterium LLY-WYZ-15_(1-7)]HJL50900.1 ferredoxin--NADP reductase [Polyangiaceae bacterium LLY-WYZ-15_(1-7)]